MNLIAAVDKNWAIGNRGKLLVTIPADQKLFREETAGKVVVMGRKTFEKEIIEMKESEVLVDFHYCPLLTAWKKLGFDDETCALFCDIAMDGDRGIAEGMGLQLDLTETLAEGCPIC